MTWLRIDAGALSLVVKIDSNTGRIAGAWLGLAGRLVADVRVGIA